MSTAAQAGAAGEERACAFLQKRGLRIVARNYRQRCGEIDLVALDGKTLVFVEVKQRATGAFGGPLAAVTPSKQHKIARTAERFIQEKRPKFDSIRFDVICLLGAEVTHLPNAFIPPRGIL